VGGSAAQEQGPSAAHARATHAPRNLPR
jgi:hypothetical protein